jgi:hypothetical protein
MLREHLINLTEAVIEKESLRNYKSSLVISWLGTGVARALRMNASEPMVGWRGEHPQSVGRLSTVIDKYSIDSANLNLNV